MEDYQNESMPDELLDQQIDQLLTGNPGAQPSATGLDRIAQGFAHLAAEESPRMSNAARGRGIQTLRARAAEKRAAQRPNVFALFRNVPRWAQFAAVALLVALVANGVSGAAANSLPGSLLYPFKRFGEDGQLLLQNTNGQRAQLWMDFANTRLDEVQRLAKSGARVDPATLDAVDESILRALGELGGTHGSERVELLKELTQLAVRQQDILNEIGQNASPSERARLERTAKLLRGVASYAQSPDAGVSSDTSPFEFLTPSTTPTPYGTPTPSRTPDAVVSQTPTLSERAVESSTDSKPDVQPTSADTEPDRTRVTEPSPIPRPDNTEIAEPTKGAPAAETREDEHETKTPSAVTREPSETREPAEAHPPTEPREPTQVREATEVREATNTREPKETRQATETREPAETRERTETRKSDNSPSRE